MSEAILAGVAALPVTKHLAKSIRDTATDVALAAIADAGVDRATVDGLFTTTPTLQGNPGFMWSCALAHHLGLRTKGQGMVECGGMTSSLALRQALDAVQLGRCKCALVVATDARALDAHPDFDHFMKNAIIGLVNLYGPYDAVYGVGAPIPYYAMSAQRYMHEHGLTRADLAEVAVALRGLASEHPRAQHRKPITVDDVLGSKRICEPLTLLDCSSFASGAAAVVVCTEEIAAASGKRAVRVAGVGEHHEPAHFAPAHGPISSFESAVQAGGAAFEEAGRAPSDIDIAEVYGVFSATELILYEDFGFFERGKAPAAVREGLTVGEGSTVFGTSGGRLSAGHPAGVTPLLSTVEVVEQLRGEAQGRQVPNADLGLVHAEHGMLNGSCVMILEGA